MSSPFPGMDPYLEAPYIWPDFHEAFATEIRGQLNSSLPPPYYARLEMRPEVGIVEDADGGCREEGACSHLVYDQGENKGVRTLIINGHASN